METLAQRKDCIEKEIFIKAARDRVFGALSERETLEKWFVQKAELDLSPGGRVRFEWMPGMFELGKVVTYEPAHCFAYTWEALEPSPTTITFKLNEETGGTRLSLSHTGIGEGEAWDAYYTSVNSGWDVHLKNLKAWLETGTCDAPGPTSSR